MIEQTYETLDADRVRAADRKDHIGRIEQGERRAVSPWSHRVEAQLLVGFEAEAAVDDGVVREAPGGCQHRLDCGRP